MRINNITTFKTNFKPAFKSKVVEVYPKDSATQSLKDKIDNFEEQPYKYGLLGSGKCSSVYTLVPNTMVIKKPLPKFHTQGEDDFVNETKALDLVPSDFKNSQQLITKAKTEKGNYYLVTTYKTGSPVNIERNPLTRDKMAKIFDSFFELDKAGIYHMDLSNNNILVDKNGANIIDYQWAKPFKPFGNHWNNTQNGILFPEDIIPANVHNYESSGFASYLHKYYRENGVQQARNLLKIYVQEKGKYFDKRTKYYKQVAKAEGSYEKASTNTTGGHSHNYEVYSPIKLERALAKVYENPNEDVLDIELMRMEQIRSDKKAYNFLDPNATERGNDFNAVPYMANALFATRNFEIKLDEYEKKYENDKYMSRYIKYNKKICKYNRSNYFRWYKSTFRNLSQLANVPSSNFKDSISIEKNKIRYFEEFKTFEPMLSLSAKRISAKSYTPTYIKPNEKDVEEMKAGINKLLQYTYFKNHELHYGKEFKNVYHMFKDIKTMSDRFEELMTQERPIDALCTMYVLKRQLADVTDFSKRDDYRQPHLSLYLDSLRVKSSTEKIIERMTDQIIRSIFLDDPMGGAGDFKSLYVPQSGITGVINTVTAPKKSLFDKITKFLEREVECEDPLWFEHL